METLDNQVNVHYAKTHLSRLIDMAVNGQPFVIAKAGKPLVTVSAIHAAPKPSVKRVGFLTGQFEVPDDIDGPYEEEILRLFEGK